MPELAAIALVVTLVVGGSAALFWLQARSERKRDAQGAAESAKFERRRRSPNLAAIEKHLGQSLPSALHALYRDQALVLSNDVLIGVPNPVENEDECYVAWFEPGDLENFTSHPWPGCEGLFRIANNGAGDQFLVDPRQPDPEVLYYLHESAQLNGIGVSLSAFLAAPRRRVPDEKKA